MKISIQTKHFYVLFLFFFGIQGYSQELEKSIFITANTGNTNNQSILTQITNHSQKTNSSTLLILGNATIKEGFSSPESESKINSQLDIISSFNGNTIFTPGHYEWATNGHRGVRKLEKFIQNNDNVKFYPDDGCPIKKKDLSENVVLITIDSQWYLENWNNHIYLNEDCDIKNRTLFFLEFESMLKKSQDKIKIIAIHHPTHSNSAFGLISNTAGASLNDYENKQYRKLRNRLTTLARQTKNTIFVSGHDKNLQYINQYGIPQIVSGSASTTKRVKKVTNGNFAVAKKGYAKLDIHKTGKVTIDFYSSENGTSTSIFSTIVFDEPKKGIEYSFKPKNSFSKTQNASVYSKEETKKSKLYRGLWGNHYRKYYSKEVNAPVVFLDTLLGGLTPVRKGGGHQSLSLRLEDKNGKQYVMRALRKSATRFLQAVAFQDNYVEEDLEDSFADKFLLDFYTTAHPYTSFAIGTLSDAVGVFHSNPQLYYIPKQQTLGQYNDEYGDGLYLFEEAVNSTHTEQASFGKPEDIISTDEILREVHKKGKSTVDEPSYIKARLFDMLIGDWDRHEDQWRWGLFKNADGTKTYKPIPRDRDQAFSVFDGGIISFLTQAIPELRKMQSFKEELKSPKWFALAPYPLDMTFLNKSDWDDWEKQAKYLQDNITDEIIDQAFDKIPNEIKGTTINEIKTKLKGRRANIVDIAHKYYKFLNKFEVLVGTQKDDLFEITRLSNGETKVAIHRKDNGIFNRTFNRDETTEIWIYGLDGNDTFKVTGKGDDLIKLKIIGGKKNDTYDFENTKKVKIYDYKSKNNTIINKRSKKWLVDDYGINNYDHKKRKYNFNQILPLIAFNPDDGLRIGVLDHFTYYGLQRNPYTQKHSLSASYYTGSSGFDISYKGEFSNIFHNWNFGIEGLYTSPNFAINFFGAGNDSEYDRDEMDLDFNRTRIRKWNAAISLIWRGRDGGYFQFKPLIESFEVENTTDRFVNTFFPANSSVFEQQTYAGAEVTYRFKNKNDIGFPTLGMDVGITAGYKSNIDGGDNENRFAYIEPHIAIDHKLTKNGRLVLATKLGGEAILGDNFEFYHGAQIGGTHSLRGFRNERFTGKYSVYQNTDLRLQMGKFKTSFVPLKYGITGGFDYGRVWLEDDNSDKWHNSVGGSFWVTGLDTFTANAGYFGSSDGGRLVFVLGFAF
ncbi:metallophosphatase [Aquimarina sp. 2201CG5-10]|uniref:metallophosphatase n=1 Tax=Aquimarina callyspongiae TaxID=3098150 RepID=UPI002AB3A22C|nr:metallophosphatase [Aquimarina sp. 2201CG5-10]MDY8134543.1 metallophosphatase [Aquimarina sp. 2201CG5-10]